MPYSQENTDKTNDVVPIFAELAAPVERALARLHLGWGWQGNEIVLVDLLPIGAKNFPVSIRLGVCVVELRTPLHPDPDAEELNDLVHSQWQLRGAAFPIYPMQEGGRELGLAVRIPLPESRKLQKPSFLAPMLRMAIHDLAIARDEFLEKEVREEVEKALAGGGSRQTEEQEKKQEQ